MRTPVTHLSFFKKKTFLELYWEIRGNRERGRGRGATEGRNRKEKGGERERGREGTDRRKDRKGKRERICLECAFVSLW